MKSNKQRRKELDAKRSARRASRERAARLEARAGGVPVDRDALAPDGSYGIPEFVERGYYIDLPFECKDCGEPQVWTAGQQRWWYEVAKGGVWTQAQRCRPCRQRERERLAEPERGKQGAPNRRRNPGLLMAEIRSQVEPWLRAAGFELVGRNRRGARRALFIEFESPGGLFTVTWDSHQARLAAESVADGGSTFQEIATFQYPRDGKLGDTEAGLARFLATVRTYLEGVVESRRHPKG